MEGKAAMADGNLILEEMRENPFIYRAYFKGDSCNSYLVASMHESLAVDVRSALMRDKLCMLAAGLGADPVKMLYFDTGGNSKDSIRARDGDKIRVGDIILHCVRSPGAGNGRLSLWIPKHGILLTGEAAGCDPLPKIRDTDDREDMLGLMFETIRFFKSLKPMCILPGKGEAAETARECQALLDGMMEKYCIQLLQCYRQIRENPGHTAEWLEEKTGRGPSGRECSCAACRKYLLYRKYVRAKEIEDGTIVYEPGSTQLIWWNAPYKELEY